MKIAVLIIVWFLSQWIINPPYGKMLILRGVASENSPDGQLDDVSALAYAFMRGYSGEVLPVAGDVTSGQISAALARLRSDPRFGAIYGFSGGAFNAVNIWSQLSPLERNRIRKVIVVGAPGIGEASFPGAAEVVVQKDPPAGHMAGPRALLFSLK